MAEIHLSVADAVIRRINDNLTKINEVDNGLTASQIGQEALGLYDWALEQMKEGLAVCVVKDGKPLRQIGLKSAPVRFNPEKGDGSERQNELPRRGFTNNG